MQVRRRPKPSHSDEVRIARRVAAGALSFIENGRTPTAHPAALARINLFVDTTSDRRNPWLVLVLGLLLAHVCTTTATAAQPQSTNPGVAATKGPPKSSDSGLPLNFARQTGDLDAMVKRGSIRALVLYSRSGFFYVNGQPEGIYYEALQYF